MLKSKLIILVKGLIMLSMLDELKKWFKKLPKDKKYIILLILILLVLFILNTDFFSKNEVAIENNGVVGNNNKQTYQNNNSGVVDSKNQSYNSGVIYNGNVNIDDSNKNELEKIHIEIQSIANEYLEGVRFYNDDKCTNEITGKYDRHNRKYTILVEMTKKEMKEIWAKKEGYHCESFTIQQNQQEKPKPVLLKIDCNINPREEECLFSSRL